MFMYVNDLLDYFCIRQNKNLERIYARGFIKFISLAMSYSHMRKPHTTIGDAPFHF